jgi:hypothetical protein
MTNDAAVAAATNTQYCGSVHRVTTQPTATAQVESGCSCTRWCAALGCTHVLLDTRQVRLPRICMATAAAAAAAAAVSRIQCKSWLVINPK